MPLAKRKNAYIAAIRMRARQRRQPRGAQQKSATNQEAFGAAADAN